MKQLDEGKDNNELCADPTFDVWSFGVVLYLLLTGSDLFSLNIGDDQLADEKERTRLVRWDGLKDEHLGRVLSYWNAKDDEIGAAKDLLTRCLHSDPKFRISSMQQVLNHPFFTREVNNPRTLEELHNIKDEIVGAVGQKIDDSIRASISIRDATLPSLWMLLPSKRTGKMACMKESFSLYGKYKLYMICQVTGLCPHEPISLFFMKAGAKNALTKAAPLLISTMLLLKVGLCAGKVAGIPLPSSLPFLDDLHDHMTNTDAFALDDLDTLVEHFKLMGESASQLIDDTKHPDTVSHLRMAQEQNRKAGLETCDQLRCLLKAGQSNPYTDEEVAALTKLQRMVHPDGSCIWVGRSENAKKQAKKYGYIESEMNMLNYNLDSVLDEEEKEGRKEALGNVLLQKEIRINNKTGSSYTENKENNEPPLMTKVSKRELYEEETFYSAKILFHDAISDEATEFNYDEESEPPRITDNSMVIASEARWKKRSLEEKHYSSRDMAHFLEDGVGTDLNAQQLTT